LIGHTNATKAQANAGFSPCAKTVTHLFNGIPKLPDEGLSDAALQRKDVIIQIIVYGVHVADDLLARTLPKVIDRFIITNDVAAGLGSGNFTFGEINVITENGQARSIDGMLAVSLPAWMIH